MVIFEMYWTKTAAFDFFISFLVYDESVEILNKLIELSIATIDYCKEIEQKLTYTTYCSQPVGKVKYLSWMRYLICLYSEIHLSYNTVIFTYFQCIWAEKGHIVKLAVILSQSRHPVISLLEDVFPESVSCISVLSRFELYCR